MDKRHTTVSKFLSYILRHRPHEVGLVLDSAGWIEIEELLTSSATHGNPISREELDYVVANNNKRRFAVSEDGLRIRASQGHSIDVALGYAACEPPKLLYHGTAERNLCAIREQGLVKGKRHHVHLSADAETAWNVGQRHGRAVVLVVRSGEMSRAGFCFYLSVNGVWLTESVPYRYIEEPLLPE